MDGLDETSVIQEDTAVARLKRAAVLERCAPELMQYEGTLVSEVSRLLLASELEDQAQHIPVDAATEETRRLIAHIREAERERIRFLLALYHRTRLSKIERLSTRIALPSEDGLRSRLAPAELAFAEDVAALTDGHLSAAFLSKLPDDARLRANDSAADDTSEAAMDGFVFAVMTESVGNFAYAPDTAPDRTLSLKEGDTIIIRYRAIRPLVLQQKAILI